MIVDAYVQNYLHRYLEDLITPPKNQSLSGSSIYVRNNIQTLKIKFLYPMAWLMWYRSNIFCIAENPNDTYSFTTFKLIIKNTHILQILLQYKFRSNEGTSFIFNLQQTVGYETLL